MRSTELHCGAVYCLTCYSGIMINQVGTRLFYSTLLIQGLPGTWHFRFFGQNEEPWLNAVWGYEELMSKEHYDQLTEMEPGALETFWKRKLETEDPR